MLACGSMGISDADVALICFVLGLWGIGAILTVINAVLLSVLRGGWRFKVLNCALLLLYVGLGVALCLGVFGGLARSDSSGSWRVLVFAIPLAVIGHSTYLFLTCREQAAELRSDKQPPTERSPARFL